MFYDFAFIDLNSDTPIWRQIYGGISEAIERGILSPSEKLPSIRELSKLLNVSRSPVENAYIHLQMEGYVESRTKSGYFVLKKIRQKKPLEELPPALSSPTVVYDFSGTGIDSKTIDLSSWRRELRKVLVMQDKIFSEGDPQGEFELREALSRYCYKARKVKASPDRIIVSSGTQQLLTELCRMMDKKGRVAIENPGYLQGERIFRDFGWEVVSIGEAGELSVENLSEGRYDIFADITSNRPQMSLSSVTKRRKELLEWLLEGDSYILEDDYNGELRYVSRPIPSLQGSYPERIIYIGSFSRLLLPSVRIAYMVVPEQLAERAKLKSSLYDQTASKIEQLTLAGYINEGSMERHIRRTRNIYQKKSKKMLDSLKTIFPRKVRCKLLETSLSVSLLFKSSDSTELLREKALSGGIAIGDIYSGEDVVTANLSFSSIPLDSIVPALTALYELWADSII